MRFLTISFINTFVLNALCLPRELQFELVVVNIFQASSRKQALMCSPIYSCH